MSDFPKVRTLSGAGSQAGASVLSSNKVLRNTYILLSVTLLFSAAMAGVSIALGVPPLPWWMALIGMFGLLFLVNATRNSAAGIASVFAFTGFFGFMLGPVISAYLRFLPNGGEVVMTALGGTGLIFAGMSIYAIKSRRDFSWMGGMLMAGMIVVFVAALANIFLHMPALQIAISAVAMLVFSAMMLYDTSRIINGGETNYLMATISLYLDIYNVFISLLQLAGIASSDD